VEAKLEAGDRIVFCTDGIPESENNEGVQFGYARTEEMVLKSCQDGLTADETIDFMLGEVETFRSGCPQSDDMTCVVIRVLDS
jgi:sigma-B regulation protein RsbU (phosphoserine phosphatase)